jgi:hypothetical protein
VTCYLVELGLPELTTEQIEILCETAENAARKYIETKIGLKMVDRIDIAVEAEGTKPVNLTIEINLILNDAAKDVDADALVKEAVAQAHLASENFLRKLV